MENTLNHISQAIMKWFINIKNFEIKQKALRLKNSLSKCYTKARNWKYIEKPEIGNQRKF